MQTLEGGLRIDVEDASDWDLLFAITNDAVSCDENLAKRLGKFITDPEVAQDWRDYIVPELDENFSSDVLHVISAIASAHLDAGGGQGHLWITPEDAFRWYSALNQSRLALEERFHFGPGEHVRFDK
ncbi:MAG: hypothetical protein H8M99_04955, partial [Gloeobacteraceae cyanobacterium ES-bin-144]|nr:hypothetical protein [Verrucomicrobiales bacterium]